MANVVRFVLSSARNLFVEGAGFFDAGVLDVDANNLTRLARARYLVEPYGAVELGIVDSATPPPDLPAVPLPPAADPYPQYLDPSEVFDPSSGRLLESKLPARLSDVELRAAFDARYVRPKQFAAGMVSVSWDDGYAVQMEIADEHEDRGQKATFFIDTGQIGAAGRLTAAQILDLHNRGHEIGAHTVTHRNMTTLTPAERTTEFEQSKATLEGILGAPVTAFTYPFGARNAASDQEAYLRFDNATFVGGGANFPLQFGLHLPRPFSSPRLDWGASAFTKKLALQLIRVAARQPILTQIYAHDPAVTATNPTWTEIREALDLIRDLGIPCVTQSEAMGGQPALINAGFEEGTDGLEGWAPPSLSAGSTATVITDAPADGLSGTKSVQLTCATDTGWSFVFQIVPVIPGVGYTSSGRYRINKTSGAGGAQLRIRWLDYLNAVIRTDTSTVGASATWAQHTLSGTAPANAVAAFVDVLTLSATATSWWDHIHFGPQGYGALG